jgi:hypothetical protein
MTFTNIPSQTRYTREVREWDCISQRLDIVMLMWPWRSNHRLNLTWLPSGVRQLFEQYIIIAPAFLPRVQTQYCYFIINTGLVTYPLYGWQRCEIRKDRDIRSIFDEPLYSQSLALRSSFAYKLAVVDRARLIQGSNGNLLFGDLWWKGSIRHFFTDKDQQGIIYANSFEAFEDDRHMLWFVARNV